MPVFPPCRSSSVTRPPLHLARPARRALHAFEVTRAAPGMPSRLLLPAGVAHAGAAAWAGAGDPPPRERRESHHRSRRCSPAVLCRHAEARSCRPTRRVRLRPGDVEVPPAVDELRKSEPQAAETVRRVDPHSVPPAAPLVRRHASSFHRVKPGGHQMPRHTTGPMFGRMCCSSSVETSTS